MTPSCSSDSSQNQAHWQELHGTLAKLLWDIPYTATKQPWDSPDEQEVQIHQLFLKGDGFHTFWTGKAYTFSCPATLGRCSPLGE